MKRVYVLMGTGLVLLLVGCASTPVVLAPVGPNWARGGSMAATGGLQVFSSLVGAAKAIIPSGISTPIITSISHGKLVKHVDNNIGYYAKAPRRVALPAGKYVVKTQASDYFWVDVPVTIKLGQTTRVHLDDYWKLPADVSKPELVSLPNGKPVGWRAD